MNEKKPKNKLNLSQIPPWLRISVAGFLSLLIVFGSYGVYSWHNNPSFRYNLSTYLGLNKSVKEEIKRNLSNGADEVLNDLSKITESPLYREYTLLDLDIYPDSWVKRNFNETEQNNQTISGRLADPDNDGLTNQEEYFYGSNPLKSKTICDGKQKGDKASPTNDYVCDGKNDKELVTEGVSPLTGYTLDIPFKFRATNQDVQVTNAYKANLELASKEGLDIPILYEKSKLINLGSEVSKIKTIPSDESAESILRYQQFQIALTESLLKNGYTTSISQIYSLSKPSDYDALITAYQIRAEDIQKQPVPKKYESLNKLYALNVLKISDMIKLRKEAIQSNSTDNSDYQTKIQAKATELIWTYRRITEEQIKLKN